MARGDCLRERVAAAVGILSIVVAACSGATTSATQAPGSSQAVGESAAPSGAPGTSITIGAILKPPSFDYFARMERGLRDKVAEMGLHLEFQAPVGFDAEEQVTRFEILKTKKFDCLVANPMSGTNLIQALVGLDVPIVNVDNPIDLDAAKAAGVKIASYVGSDNVAAGRLAGERMVELLGGSGAVAAIAGEAANQTSKDRISGFKTAAEAGGLQVVQEVAADWDREKALTAAEDIMRAHPDLRGFFAANDGMGLGIQTAVDNAGKTGQIHVISVDGDWEALESIKAGRLAATVSQYPYVAAQMAVEACVAAVRGATLPAKVDAPIALITKDNVQQAMDATPKAFSDYVDPYADLLK